MIKPRLSCLTLLLLAAFSLAAPAARADCEGGGEASGTADGYGSDISARSTSMGNDVAEDWRTSMSVLQSTVAAAIQSVTLDKLSAFWHDDRKASQPDTVAGFGDAWKGMARQLSAATLRQTADLGRVADADAVLAAALDMQRRQVESMRRNQPTLEACTFDTIAASRAPVSQSAPAFATAFENDLTLLGENAIGTVSADGPAGFAKARWEAYSNLFCDPDAENGQTICKPPEEIAERSMYKNNDVLPGNFLGKDTLSLSSEKSRIGLLSLLLNVTGYTTPPSVYISATNPTANEAEVMTHRRYIAQMNAIAAPLIGALADRAPGAEADDVRDLRAAGGAVQPLPSRTPSARELRRAVVERLWDPAYYQELVDNPAAVAQKEIYLRAYNLMLLHELIARQEKISGVYAVQTANMIEKAMGVLRSPAQTQGLETKKPVIGND